MRKPLVVLCCIIMMCAFIGACAKGRYERVEMRGTLLEAAAGDRAYLKQALFIPQPGLTTPFGRQAEDIFLQSLIDTIHTKAEHLTLVTPRDKGFPQFLATGDISSPGHISKAAEKARMMGYHYFVQAGLWNAEPIKEKKGFWFFRKERGYVNLVVALDVYDTFTGAKIVSLVVDDRVRITMDEYEGLMAGLQAAIAEVDESAADYGEDLGDLAADAMSEGKWMASVISVEGQSIVLAAGSAAGLREGDRLALYEGRRVVAGPNGKSYVAPGYKLGNIRIVSITETSARATMDTTHRPADIKPGDIALPAP